MYVDIPDDRNVDMPDGRDVDMPDDRDVAISMVWAVA